MEDYRRALQAAAAQNDTALRTLFGAPEESLLDRARAFLDDDHSVYDGLGSVWRHAAKDWTADGTAAARALRARVVELVADEAPSSVLVPGCGQARLAWELAERLPCATVTGLEPSAAQLQIARHMLACAETASIGFHPFLDEPRNALDASTRTVQLHAPDVAPAGGDGARRLRLEQTDLDGWRAAAPEPVECVVTSFFIDCLPDAVAALEAVWASLAPGGFWVCAGPLAYHHWPQPSPTLSHLRTLAREVGLRPIGPAELIPAPPIGPPLFGLVGESERRDVATGRRHFRRAPRWVAYTNYDVGGLPVASSQLARCTVARRVDVDIATCVLSYLDLSV